MVWYSETRGQRKRREVGERLPYRWPNTRPDRRPRGLRNLTTYCYRNSVLQMLAHLPKFVHWILQHNELGQNWPCCPDDPNRKLPVGQEEDRAILKMNQKLILGCVPCRLKTFFQDYWGPQSSPPGRIPEVFPVDRASILPLHKMGERWNCHLPQSRKVKRLLHETDAHWIQRRLTRETAHKLSARLNNACGQHCADEYLGYLFAGIMNSIDPVNTQRLDEYAALFMLQRHQETRCSDCNEVRPDSTDYLATRDTGFSLVRPLPVREGSDDLLSAIARSEWMEMEEREDLQCPLSKPPTCSTQIGVITKKIVAAPVYLRVHFDLTTLDKKSNQSQRKNMNPIKIPDILDLTPLVYSESEDSASAPFPLTYKLISVLYHAGRDTTYGHWAAGVSHALEDPELTKRTKNPKGKKSKAHTKRPTPEDATLVKQYYFCSDDQITEMQTERDSNPLTVNPYTARSGSTMNAVVVMYERIKPKGRLRRTPERTPKMVRELASNLEKRCYGVGQKEEEEGGDSGGKKWKEAEDTEEHGLRRSKRLKAKK